MREIESVNTVPFGAIDYWRMCRKGGPRLPLRYFFENHLFDLLHRTDTHRWLPLDRFDQSLLSLAHGVLYMCSWTSIIRRTLAAAEQTAPFDFATADLIDIGCGKGKVLLVWSKLLANRQHGAIFGVEYSPALLEICRDNLAIMGIDNVSLIQADASQLDTQPLSQNLILYMYNPFDAVILDDLLDRLQNRRVVAIYNNPVHAKVFIQRGYRSLSSATSWHPNGAFTIFSNASNRA